jgi:hypothetical protein
MRTGRISPPGWQGKPERRACGGAAPGDGRPLAAAYEAALAVLKAQGAVLVEVERPPLDGLGEAKAWCCTPS